MRETVAIGSGDLAVRLCRQGGALLGATFRGRPFLRAYDGPSARPAALETACFPMLPFCNRIGGNAFVFDGERLAFEPNMAGDPLYNHGDGWLGLWDFAEVGQSHAVLAFERGADAASPYAYRATQRAELHGAVLVLTLEIENRSVRSLPFGIGFHPYFPRADDTLLLAPAANWWTEGDLHLPQTREPPPGDADFAAASPLPVRALNNAYEGWGGRAEIVWPRTDLRALMTADGLFSRYMLYAPDTDRSFFCLEPMSHMPNALGNGSGLQGLRVLEPGQKLSGAMSIAVSTLEDNHG